MSHAHPSRWRGLAVAVTVAALSALGTWSAGAAECGLLGLMSCADPTTTTTSPPAQPNGPPPAGEPAAPAPPPQQPSPEPPPADPAPAPAESNAPPPGFILSPEGEPMLPPPPEQAPPPPGSDGAPGDAGPPVPELPGDGEEPPVDAGPFPDNLRRLQNSVKRTPANNTSALLEALAPLGQYGVSPEEAALIGFGRFPVGGMANYSHDWWFPRFGPGWRLHMGTDIFAPMGTPVRAPTDGTIRISNGGLGGLSVYVVEPNGTFWYLAHNSGIAEGITTGSAVTAGQVVAFVGDSGNARGGSPHVHAEYHPGGGAAVDPKSVLDGFLTEAIDAAPALIQRYADAAAAETPIPSVATPGVAGASSFEAPRAALLWASAMSPSGGAMVLAEAEAARVAGAVDWTEFQAQQADTSRADATVEAAVRSWLDPLTPPALRDALAGSSS